VASTSTPLPVEQGGYFRLVSLVTSKRGREKIALTAISATGRTVAILTKRKFWVFNTRPVGLACIGEFTNGNVFRYAFNDKLLKPQNPIPHNFKVSQFTCVALSDKYLAVGAPGRVMSFILEGSHAGRWVVSDELPDARTLIEKLRFSASGRHLLAVLTVENESSGSKALFYSTNSFEKRHLERADLIQPKADEVVMNLGSSRPSGAAFSSKGTSVAICTTHSGATASIVLLREINATWTLWGIVKVPVFAAHDLHDRYGHGLTGISL